MCYFDSLIFFLIITNMMSGSKAPDFDAYGLLRATHSYNPTKYSHIVGLSSDFDAYGLLRVTHSHNPTKYSHIVGLSSHFYAHIGASPKLSPTYEQAHVGLDLLTLAS